MGKVKRNNRNANDKEVYTMPTIEMVECERVAYVKGMEQYLRKLKAMPNNEAVEKSQINLESCHIIQEDGEFTERYIHSRMHTNLSMHKNGVNDV